MPLWLAALLGFAIVARVTRFLNSDYLFGPVRDRVEGWTKRGKLFYLLTCSWCASIWVAFPVSLVVTLAYADFGTLGNWFVFGGLWGGYSYLYGRLAASDD